MVGVGLYKGGFNLDKCGVWCFGVAGEGETMRKEEKRGRRKGKKRKMGAGFFLKIKYKN